MTRTICDETSHGGALTDYTRAHKQGELQSALGEARDRLPERGEKLSRIEQRTAEMEQDAANFADLAKELAEKHKRGGWF